MAGCAEGPPNIPAMELDLLRPEVFRRANWYVSVMAEIKKKNRNAPIAVWLRWDDRREFLAGRPTMLGSGSPSTLGPPELTRPNWSTNASIPISCPKCSKRQESTCAWQLRAEITLNGFAVEADRLSPLLFFGVGLIPRAVRCGSGN